MCLVEPQTPRRIDQKQMNNELAKLIKFREYFKKQIKIMNVDKLQNRKQIDLYLSLSDLIDLIYDAFKIQPKAFDYSLDLTQKRIEKIFHQLNKQLIVKKCETIKTNEYKLNKPPFSNDLEMDDEDDDDEIDNIIRKTKLKSHDEIKFKITTLLDQFKTEFKQLSTLSNLTSQSIINLISNVIDKKLSNVSFFIYYL